MTARTTVLALAGAAALAAGCSSGATYQPPSNAAGALQNDVLALSRAAATRNSAAAQSALARLRADLSAARADGAVSATRISAIEQAMAAVATDLSASTRTASTPTPSPTPTPTKTTAKPQPPAPKPPAHHKKHKPHH